MTAGRTCRPGRHPSAPAHDYAAPHEPSRRSASRTASSGPGGQGRPRPKAGQQLKAETRRAPRKGQTRKPERLEQAPSWRRWLVRSGGRLGCIGPRHSAQPHSPGSDGAPAPPAAATRCRLTCGSAGAPGSESRSAPAGGRAAVPSSWWHPGLFEEGPEAVGPSGCSASGAAEQEARAGSPVPWLPAAILR